MSKIIPPITCCDSSHDGIKSCPYFDKTYYEDESGEERFVLVCRNSLTHEDPTIDGYRDVLAYGLTSKEMFALYVDDVMPISTRCKLEDEPPEKKEPTP